MNKKFSIIIPSYNTSEYISTCISSILCQTFKDYEIILVDDCSSDQNIILEKIKKIPEIKFFSTEKNSGPGAARNLGLAKATGQYIVFIDSDDTLASEDALEKINNTIGDTNPDIIYTGFQFIGEEFTFIPDNSSCTK